MPIVLCQRRDLANLLSNLTFPTLSLNYKQFYKYEFSNNSLAAFSSQSLLVILEYWKSLSLLSMFLVLCST